MLKGHFNQVYSLKWRADDLALYSGDKGGAVYEWNVAFGQRIIDHDYVSKSLEISSHGSLDVITCEPYEDSNYLSHARLADHKKKEDQEEAEAGGYGYESAPAAAPVALPPRHPVCLTVINNADSTLRFLKDGNGDFKMSISASFKKVSQRALNLVGVDMNGGKEEGFERGGSHYVQDKYVYLELPTIKLGMARKHNSLANLNTHTHTHTHTHTEIRDFTQARCINLLGNGRVCLTASTTGSLIAIKVEKTLNRFRDNSDLDPEFIADKDRSESELLRQRNMLEGLNSALEARVDRAERRRVKSNGDMMRQNEALLEDNAELRKENKTLGDKLNKLETRIFQLEGSKRSSTKGGPSSSTPSTPAADRGSSAGSKHPLYESRGAFRASKAIRSPPVSRSESASRPSTAAGGGFQPALKGSLRTGGTSRALNEIVQWERERIEELLGRLELSHREIERRDQELASLRAAHGVADPPSHAEYPPSPAPPYSSARPSTAPVAQHGTQTAPSAIPTAVPSPVHAPSIGGWRGGSARPARFSAPRASSRPSTGR